MTEPRPSLEFLVDLNCQEQVDQLRKALANRKGEITDMIDLIDPPLPYDDLNLDKCHLESLFTATAHTTSGTTAGTELVEKRGSSVINSQADESTHEMKEIRPEPGSIYMLQLSIPEAFGIFESGEPEISSFASCTSSSSSTSTKSNVKSSASPTKQKKNDITNGHVSFHGHDPASTDTNATIVLPELTRNYLFKHLLSIYPNPPVFGRNSIKIKSICSSMYFTPKDKHYLILKPISISSGTKWPKPIPDFVESHELHYISQVVFELMTEERQSSASNSQLQIIFTNPGGKTDDEQEDTDGAKTTSSSSSSSLPMPRFEQYLLLHNDFNKFYQVQQWLTNLE